VTLATDGLLEPPVLTAVTVMSLVRPSARPVRRQDRERVVQLGPPGPVCTT